MKNFYYKVKTNKGTFKTGNINALNIEDAANKLKQKNLIIIEISEIITINKNIPKYNYISKDKVFSIKEKLEFFNALYSQYKAGISISEIFYSIMKSSSNLNIKGFCFQIIKGLEKNHSLKETLKHYKNVLGPAYTTLIFTGEETGKLDRILYEIIKNIKKEDEIKRNLISSLSYPFSILCLAIAVLYFFHSFIFKIFDMIGTDICQSTIMSLFIFTIIKIIIFFAIFGIIIYILLKNDKTKKIIINFIQSGKIISKLLKQYYFQSFFLILSLAYNAGIPPVEAIYLANSVIKMKQVNKKIEKAAKMISEGCTISTAFNIANIFSDFAISQISAGENSGELDKMFKLVADDYENKLDLEIKVFIKIIEPLLLIIIGIFVAYIAYSGYTRYYDSLFSMI